MSRSARSLALLLATAIALAGGCRPDREARRAGGAPSAGATRGAASAADEAFRQGGAHGSRLSPEDRVEPVARVGERLITLGDLEAHYAALPEEQRFQYASPHGMRELLEHVVDFEVLAAEARSAELWRSPRVLLAVKLAMVEEMLRAEAESLAPVPPVTESDIEAEYRAHRERYHAPRRVRLSLLVTETEEAAHRLRAEILEKGDGSPEATMAAFREVAVRYSVDARGRGKGGDLGFVTEGPLGEHEAKLPGVLRRAGLALTEIGSLSPVIDVGTRYHVVALTERDGGEILPLAQATAAARQRVLSERQEEALNRHVSELRRRARVEIHDEVWQQWRARTLNQAPRRGG